MPFTTVGADHAQEQTNRDLKGGGGLQGITNKPATLLKYCLTVPVLSQISKQTEVMLGLFMASNESYNHHLSDPRIKKQESAIAAIKDALGPHKVFNDESSKFHNLVTKQVLKADAQASILDVVGRGERAKVAFVQDRVTGETYLWDRMTKVKYLNPNSPKGGVVPTPLTVFALVLKIAQPRGKIAPGTFKFILSLHFSEKIPNLPPTRG